MVRNNVVIDPEEIVYANAYSLPAEQSKPGLGQRLFLIFRGGGKVTLHNEMATLVGSNLGIEAFPVFP